MATAEQITKHRAKMAMKARRVLTPGFTPMDDKRFAAERLKRQLAGQPVTPNLSRWAKIPRGQSAAINRLTGQPHEHAREIPRNRRQAAARA